MNTQQPKSRLLILSIGLLVGGAPMWADSLTVEGHLHVDGNVGIGTNTPAASLDVAGDAKVQGDLTVLGNVSLPSQVAGGGSGVLTQDLGDARYLSKDFGPYSQIAIGDGAVAEGATAIAIGAGAYAWGSDSTVIGLGGIAYYGGTAIGVNANSTGDFSTSIGYKTLAWGSYSTALGANTRTEGSGATAMGLLTYAHAQHVTALGVLNVLQGESQEWIPTDDLVVVGNGEPNEDWTDGQRSNAFVIHKNGDMRVAGSVQAKAGFRTPPMGDLSMGQFTAGDNPSHPVSGLNAGLRYPSE